MFLETLAAVSLHCTLSEFALPGDPAPTVNAQVYIDYERDYGYMTIAHQETPEYLETHSLIVTPENIRFVSGGFGGLTSLRGATIDRTTGAFAVQLYAGLRRPGPHLNLNGTCRPGDPIQLPQRPEPLF